MNKIILILCIFGLFGCNTDAVKKQSANNEEQGMASKQWLDLMRPAIASSMCDDKNLLRNCFRTNKSECEKISLASVSTCIDLLKPQIPDYITRQQARHLGGTLGVCSAKAYALVNHTTYINKPECQKFSIANIKRNK